jgi:hypothetical protein
VRLSSEVIGVSRLTVTDRAAMLELMQRHYENVLPDRFFYDLDQKTSVIFVREPEHGALCGFSTQAVVECAAVLDIDTPNATGEARRQVAIFSGDTIVDRRYWGDPALGQAWGRFALGFIEDHPDASCCWFLISQGFRTYRYLPLFFREFYPRHDRPTPAWAAERIASLARQMFGPRFDARRMVVPADEESYRVREEYAAAGERVVADPHVAHFEALNPFHRRGDELCCLAPLSRENFTPAAWRVIRRSTAAVVGANGP